MAPGDVLFFHNLCLHGSGVHEAEDFVRWAIDLRYERAPDPTRYTDGAGYYSRNPSFRCASAGAAMAWPEWRLRWSETAGRPAEYVVPLPAIGEGARL